MNNDITALTARLDAKEIETLRAQIDATDDWATGVFLLLEQVLPFLLRGHPEAEKLQKLLQKQDDRYEELLAHPDRAEDDERIGVFEATKMMNRQLALLGVWPNIDPKEAAQKELGRDVRLRPG